MCFKFKEKTINPIVQVNLIDDDSKVAFALGLLASNTKKEVCDGIIYFLYKRKYIKRKVHRVIYDTMY
jgi:hypothetical protein